MVLKAPLRLIGPKSPGCEMGWLGENNMLEQLRSLAEELQLTPRRPSSSTSGRHGSEDVDSYSPSKRRDCDAVEKGDATGEAVDLFSHPSFHRWLRLFEDQARKTDQLADELGRLRENHSEIEAQIAATNDRQEDVFSDATVGSLVSVVGGDIRVWVLPYNSTHFHFSEHWLFELLIGIVLELWGFDIAV
ncbi:uncharacterized protein PG998_014209 [Apiospora kogelbergensis]|uniref:uncharacterized protein n=1 Tax=Apiospora kogelbergensis TaxID=1337665 RepID=UPI00312F7EF5